MTNITNELMFETLKKVHQRFDKLDWHWVRYARNS